MAIFAISYLASFISLLLFVWFCELIDIQPTYLMFLLPYFLMLSNDYKRIENTKNGKTRTEQWLNDFNEPYNYRLQIKMEYGYLIGDLFGITIFLLLTNKLPL